MEDTKIYLILCEEEIRSIHGHPIGRKRTVVSHGVGNNTLRNYCLPPEPPENFKPKRDAEGIYIDA